MKAGIDLIAEERQRQIEEEGWTKEHDAEYVDDSLAFAAVCYAIPSAYRKYSYVRQERIPDFWPWNKEWWKPCPEDRIRELTKAGALIAAEIDRLQLEKVSMFLDDGVKPKFDVGDIVKQAELDVVVKITDIRGGYYVCEGSDIFISIESQDAWELYIDENK